MVAVADGSPPHAWGRPWAKTIFAHLHRFTPTCVGKTGQSSIKRAYRPVHPYMRGEDGLVARAASANRGSPPHAWGRQPALNGPFHVARFTPTCVGKTTVCSRVSVMITVHPHMRGEDVTFPLPYDLIHGSPPHAWGRHAPCSDQNA